MRKIIKAFEDLFLLVMKRWMSFIFLHTMMTQEGAGNFHSFSFCFIQIIFFIFFLAGWKMKMFPLRRENKGKGSLFLLDFTDCEKYIIGDRRWRMWWKIRWWRWGGGSFMPKLSSEQKFGDFLGEISQLTLKTNF